jgi:hypothetical protein
MADDSIAMRPKIGVTDANCKTSPTNFAVKN